MDLESSRDSDLWSLARTDCRARDQLCALAEQVANAELANRGIDDAHRPSLVQEAICDTLDFLARDGQVRSNLRAFLRWRARHVISTHRRRNEKAPEPLTEMDSPDRARENCPESLVSRKELYAALDDCSTGLKVMYREVVDFRYRRGLSSKEIAARLGIPTETVNVRVFRAMQHLRACLEEKGFEK